MQSELERDRLAMELEEERRLRETLEHRLAKQKMSQNHNNTDISVEQFADSSQVCLVRQQHVKLLLVQCVVNSSFIFSIFAHLRPGPLEPHHILPFNLLVNTQAQMLVKFTTIG